MIETYFNAERIHGLMFVAVGLVTAGLAVWAWRHAPFWRGAAWPLLVVALIQLLVGVSLWWQSPKESVRVQQIVAQERARIASEEIPRMQGVMKGFRTLRQIELGLLAVGLLLLLFASRGSVWQGVGLGLAVQVGLVMVLDVFAEKRGLVYLDWLRAL